MFGAFTFSYNWVSISGDTSYFRGATPELFRNFWSLGVEEQFYVLWPLLLPVLLIVPRVWGRAAAVAGLAAASAVWMGVVAASGNITRAYFGTDTHAFGILLGVGLAFALARILARVQVPAAPVAPVLAGGWKVIVPRTGSFSAPVGAPVGVPVALPSSRVVRATAIAGSAALLGLLVVALIPPTETAATFPGAILAASVLSAVAITAGMWPGSAFGRVLDRQPLRWIGDRSYGIYLWHWPLLVLAVAAMQRTGPEVGFSPWLGLFVLALTLVVAELSYRLVEMPVRRFGFRGMASRVGARLRGTPQTRLGALTVVAAGLLVVGGTGAAIAAAPEVSSAQSIVDAGAAALEVASEEPEVPDAAPTPSSSAADEPTEPATSPTSPDEPDEPAPVPSPTPTPITGDQISAIGDSVMLASAPGLLERLPGIEIDAAVSRSTWAGPGIVQALADRSALRPFVVVALGTNGAVSLDALQRMVDITGPDRHVVLVNAYGPRDWIPGVNADLEAFADAHPRVVVADWSGAIGGRIELLAGDRIHPSSGGGRVFADVVASTVDAIEADRVQRQYEADVRRYEHEQRLSQFREGVPVPQ